uniref:thioesterase domain-containing protein n=1 Tax=Ramlibacter sp. TaxID=1917967 RepID=UPI00182BF52D
PKDRPEVAIRTGRAGAALFCVPGAGDSVVGFAPLAAVLGDDFSLYGLQPRGTDGELVPHSSVRAAATHYVQAVQRVRPHGPLHLFGHSFGGWIVFEMAHQLRALGRSIASLTIVDSEAPDGRQSGLGEEHGAGQALARFVEVLELAAGQPLGVDAASLARLHPAAMRKQLHAAMARSGLLPARSSPDVLVGPIRTFATALRTSYRPPRVYDGVVRLVLVADTRFSAEDNQHHQIACLSGWQAWAPQTRLWIGPGNHMTVLKDANVRALCRWWTDAVATADAAH